MESLDMSASLSSRYVHGNISYDRSFGRVIDKDFLQSMLDSDEVGWFNSYSKYFEGEPRSMSRTLNIYIVARGIAEQKKRSNVMTRMFRKKLLQIVALTELWPYRMSWLAS